MAAAVAIAACGMVLGSCKKKPELENPAEYRTVVGGETVYTEPSVFQSNVGLHAKRVGDELVISAVNQRPEEVVIYYKDLGLLVPAEVPGAKRKLVLIGPQNALLTEVTPLFLGQGQQGVMRIPMLEPSLMAGSRLVYNNPRNSITFFVEIE
jgi:hypothetical protein